MLPWVAACMSTSSDQAPGDIIHDNHNLPRNYLAHQITIKASNHLSEIIAGSEAFVNSLHHQGIRDLRKKLIPTATPDGLIEAFELPGHPFSVAVPSGIRRNCEDHEVMRRLFQSFIQSCQVGNSFSLFVPKPSMTEKYRFQAVIEDAGGGGAYVTIPFDVEKAFGKNA